MNWDNLKIFLAIAQKRGLKKAARKLGIHHTSCARRIKAFEEELGAKLFHRLPDGYTLTQAGKDLQQSAYKIQDEINTIEHDLLGQDTRLEGDICVTIPNGLILHLLMPDIAEFIKLHPEVNVEINMSYEFRDLATREADIAIRMVDNPPKSLAGSKVGQLFSTAYASKTYLKNHDPLNSPEKCHWLGWGDAADHLKWAEKKKHPRIPVRGNMYSDVLQVAAAKTELGITSLHCYIGDADTELERIPDATPTPASWVWVLAHKDMMTNARVAVFMDFIAKAFKKYQPLLEGKTYQG